MRRKRALALSALLACVPIAPRLDAQEARATVAAPKVMQIYREELKPGKGPAHAKVEPGFARAFAKANWPFYYVAMQSITGPVEVWFLTAYDSYASWQKDRQAAEATPALLAELDRLSEKDGELLSGYRSIVAVYREDLSYKPKFDVAHTRYVRVLITRVRPGHDAEAVEAKKIVKEAAEKANADIEWATYQVSGGLPVPTFLTFFGMKSLAEMDAVAAIQKSILEAAGENAQKLAKLSEADASIESNFYEVKPSMSYVPKRVAAADPGFWTPKPKAAAAPAGAAKDDKKPAEKK